MPHPLLLHARRVLAAHFAGQDWRALLPGDATRPSRGCFVSLKVAGRLRGCIGTVLPVRPTLEEEVAENALASATRDPRFDALQPVELPLLALSIDLLGRPEPVAHEGLLDARRYGVLLRAEGKLGVLLPDIPGVDTPDQQIAICQEKAGVAPGTPYRLERFIVERYSEEVESSAPSGPSGPTGSQGPGHRLA